MRRCLLVLLLWLTAAVAKSVAQQQQQQQPSSSNTYYASTPGDWADPKTWSLASSSSSSDQQQQQQQRQQFAGQDPGGQVVISTTVFLSANATVASVAIVAGGVLSCDRRAKYPITLTTARLVVESGGCFTCTGGGGAPTCGGSKAPSATIVDPYMGPPFTLKLASSRPPQSADDDVRTLLVKNGGAMVLVGGRRRREEDATTTTTTTTTRLSEHAMVGSTQIVVADPDSLIASTWHPGDRIAIAPTDYNPDQTEYFDLVAVARSSSSSSTTTTTLLTLNTPLKYARTGKAYGLIHPTSQNPPNQTFVLDARAEVALLTRNIVVQGTSDDALGLQGDVRVTGSDVHILLNNVAFNDLGRRGHMGRYPLHFHGLGSGGNNVVVDNVVVHRSSQRGIVVHCTSGATFTQNVVADVQGFAFMLEDGAEENNVFTDNWALDVRPPHPTNTGVGSLVTERDNVAAFWFLNSANTFINNVAAGVQGSGFVLDLDPKLIARPSTYTLCPEQVPGFDVRLLNQGTSKSTALLGASVYKGLASKTFVRFENNVVHAAHTGLWMSSLPQQGSLVRVDSFTGWKLGTRLGAQVAFDACVRLTGVQGMKLNRLACANSALSYWSTESGVVTNTLLAWLTDGGAKTTATTNASGTTTTPQLIPSGAIWKPQWATRHNGLQSYLSSQVFVNTYAYGSFPPGQLTTDFSVSASGALTGAHNLVAGFRRDAADWTSSSSSSPVLALDVRMQHAFTDVTGELFASGSGMMRALCNCAGCGNNQVDPLIAVYAPGQCSVVGGGGGTASSSGMIACAGASSSLLCRPSFVTVEVRGVGGKLGAGQQQHQQQSLLRVEAPANLGGATQVPWSRVVEPNGNVVGTSTWRFLAPMTPASADAVAGGYRFRSNGNGDWGLLSLSSLVLVVGHTTDPQGALTLVISRVPEQASVFADLYPWRDVVVAVVPARTNGSATTILRIDPLNGLPTGSSADPSSCAVLVRSACPPAPAPCACQTALGGNDRGFKDVYVRFRTWGEMDASILDTQGQPYLYKLAKYQVRIQLSDGGGGQGSSAAAAAAAAAAMPPDYLFASLNTALQSAPAG